MKNKILALISVRTSSRRLPNKALIKLKNINILDRVVLNLKGSNLIDKIIVTTSLNSADKTIYNYCKKKNYECFRGDEINVIKRFYDASKKYKPKIIIRVTGDNPFTSFELTDFMIRKHFKNKVDFTYMDKKKLPSGVCPEIISFQALKKILSFDLNFDFSEYMTFYFINNKDIFKIKRLAPPKRLISPIKRMRLTLDYKNDLLLIKKILDCLDNRESAISLNEIYNVINNNKSWLNINKNINPIWKRDKNLAMKIKNVSRISLNN